MAELGVILTTTALSLGSVAAGMGGYSLLHFVANNDSAWNQLPPQVQNALRDHGLVVGR